MRLTRQIILISLGVVFSPMSFADGGKATTLVPELVSSHPELAGNTPLTENPWKIVDEGALAAGPMYGASYQEIASKITEGLTTDTEKTRAIYRWMSEHIGYDVQVFKLSLEGTPITNVSAESTLQRRRGVCSGYADLFAAMGGHVGLTVKSVDGFAKGWGYKEGQTSTVPNHAWNAILIDGRWKLVDVTWAAGSVTNDLRYIKRFKDEYFFPEPTEFVKKHVPTQPVWSLLDGDEFSAPVVRRPQADLLDINVLAPNYGDITIASGETFEIVLPERADLRVGGWLSGANSGNLMGASTAYLPYTTGEDGSLVFVKQLEEAGRYKFWIGADTTETDGPLMIALEFNIHVKPGTE